MFPSVVFLDFKHPELTDRDTERWQWSHGSLTCFPSTLIVLAPDDGEIASLNGVHAASGIRLGFTRIYRAYFSRKIEKLTLKRIVYRATISL